MSNREDAKHDKPESVTLDPLLADFQETPEQEAQRNGSIGIEEDVDDSSPEGE